MPPETTPARATTHPRAAAPPPGRRAGPIPSFGTGPGLFASWLLLLLVALRVQRALQTPPIPIGPGASRALTILFLMGWVFGIFWAILSLPSSARGQGLVTTGPFARVRHPLYAVSLFFLGFLTIVSSRSWVVAAAWPLSYALALFWVRFEEKGLEARFGEAWRAYARKTPRFLPRPVPRQRPHRSGQAPGGGTAGPRVSGRGDPG